MAYHKVSASSRTGGHPRCRLRYSPRISFVLLCVAVGCHAACAVGCLPLNITATSGTVVFQNRSDIGSCTTRLNLGQAGRCNVGFDPTADPLYGCQPAVTPSPSGTGEHSHTTEFISIMCAPHRQLGVQLCDETNVEGVVCCVAVIVRSLVAMVTG